MGLENDVLAGIALGNIWFRQPKGVDWMSNLNEGQQYTVDTQSTDRLHLRKEPSTKSTIILRMDNGATVTLKSTEVRTSDGYEWYYVSYTDNDTKVWTGWAASEFLEQIPARPPEDPIVTAPAGGNLPTTYTFKYAAIKRKIYEPTLKNAIGSKLSKTKLTNSTAIKIKLNKPYQNQDTYWTTKENLKNITVDPDID